MATLANSILVVDDDPVLRTAVVAQIEALGHAPILQARDGLEALERVSEGGIELVVTDLDMPGLDGLGLMRQARERGSDVSWIILSGMDTFAAAVEAIQLGAFDFIAKPAEVERLRVAVGNALEQRALRRERDRLTTDLEQRNRLLALELRELASLCQTLEEQAETIRLDLERAEVIQRALLPRSTPALAGIRVEALYRPGRHVGGDLYDLAMLSDHQYMVLVADASGHGVSSAMVSVLLKHRLRPLLETGEPAAPSRVLADLNRALYADISPEGMFVSAVYGLIDTVERSFTVASAGHPPVIVAADGKVERIRRTGPALGLEPDAAYREATRTLAAGERVLLYTDGVQGLSSQEETEAFLDAELLAAGDARAVLDSVFDTALASAGDGPDADPDDVTMVLLEVSQGESHLDHSAARGVFAPGATRPQAAGPPLALEVARDERRGFAYLVGRCTWTSAPALQAFASATFRSGLPLVLDLSRCEHVDSTILGTLHEIVSSGERQGLEVALQAVSDEHRALFSELDMSAVQERVRERCVEPPDALETPTSAGSSASRHATILRAHETLASLSESNQEAFRGVIEDLSRELRTKQERHTP